MHDKTRHQPFLTLSKGFINKMITINDIITAYEKTKTAIIKTPLITSDRLNQKLGFRLWVKCEMFREQGLLNLEAHVTQFCHCQMMMHQYLLTLLAIMPKQ
ncbi:MAG: hypothetical protein CM15mP117_21060 [Alphaproteobacteria bacterium]|nr:MAG: hypothetical protein CM15mP117_21060 [Alphaproteobacteria bacterium]